MYAARVSSTQRLRELLSADDADTREQGIELAKTLGDEVIAQLLARARITPKPTHELFGGMSWLGKYLPKKLPQVVPGTGVGRKDIHGVMTTLRLAMDSDCRTAWKLRTTSKLGLSGRHNDVLDLEPLRGFEELKLLVLVQALNLNAADALSELSNLERLVLLQIRDLDLQDVQLPSTLKRLFAHSSGRGGSCVLKLSGLPNLFELAIRANAVTLDAAQLESPALQTLAVATTSLTLRNPEGLSRLHKLRDLELMYADAIDLALLPTSLRALRITGAKRLDNLEALANLTRLQHLEIESTPIDTWKPLAQLPALEKLWVRHTKIEGQLPAKLVAKCSTGAWRSKWS